MATIKERVTDEKTGREVIIYDDGTRKWGDTGYFISGPPAKQINSSERGRALAQIAKDNAFMDKAKAFARRNGIDPDTATPEEILQGYSRGRENLHGHAYDLMLASKTARGAEGLYSQLVRVSDDPAVGFTDKDTYTPDEMHTALTKLVGLLREAIQPPETIEGTFTTPGE